MFKHPLMSPQYDPSSAASVPPNKISTHSTILTVDVPEFQIHGKTLLSQVRFSLNSNELIVIIGRNGAGKSTLLKHITTEISNPKAYIEIFGKEVSEHKIKDLAQRRAVLPQSTQLNFAYEVLEVVLLGRIPHQKGQSETQEDIDIAFECLKDVGLKGYETRNYLTLSGGEQQRVHFARVLAQLARPQEKQSSGSEELKSQGRLLLLDEPTSSLDIAHQHQSLQLVKKQVQKDLSCIAILHDLNLASQYADRVLVLDKGKLLAFGTPKEVLTSEVLSQAFNYKIITAKHPELDCPLIISC